MEAENRHEHIEAYLAGTLSPDAHRSFSEELAADPALQKEVELHRKAQRVIHHGLLTSRKEALRKIDAGMGVPAVPHIRRHLWVRRLAVAATVLLIIAVGGHFYTQALFSHEALAGQYFEPIKQEVYRDGNTASSPAERQLLQGQEAFKAHRYEEAKAQFLAILKEDTLLKPQAEWNLLMCYLATDPDGSQFQVLLDHILQDENHPYHDYARDIDSRRRSALYRFVNR